MLETLDKNQKFLFFIIIGIMILFIIFYIYNNLLNTSDSSLYSEEFDENTLIEEPSSSINEISNITIYICGEVKESKVISLPENSRIIDALESVGGLTEEADISSINLAAFLEDGEKIYIPSKNESYILEDYSTTSHTAKNKININTASQSELESISGIGPSTALKIINYRESNGKFKSIEDIKNVPGIGDSKFENIKDYIRIK